MARRRGQDPLAPHLLLVMKSSKKIFFSISLVLYLSLMPSSMRVFDNKIVLGDWFLPLVRCVLTLITLLWMHIVFVSYFRSSLRV